MPETELYYNFGAKIAAAKKRCIVMAEIQENRRKILRSSFGVSVATVLARILGLLRVMLEARVLGGGAMASAWQLGFMMPNLLRRLFGEGALSTALIPMLSHLEAAEGLTEVRRRLTGIFLLLSALLAALAVLVSGVSLALLAAVRTEYIRVALKLIPILMPYTIFICLVGVMTAVVNTRRVFFLASLNALLLNLVLIAVLLAGQAAGLGGTVGFLHRMAYSVVLAGVLQLALMLVLMWKCSIFPILRGGLARCGTVFRELFLLALPGMVGGAAGQISFLVDRALACWVGDYAVASLSYSERLVYLPIGVFAMALSSVLMADMSRAAARKNYVEMADDCALGLRYVWYFCAPLGVFLVVWREPLIRLLFMYGKFTEFHVGETAWALLFYSLGIPAFCATKVILPMFYARKKMTTPLKVSLVAVGVNIVMNIPLMLWLRQGGIALATVISAGVNNVLLLAILKRENLGLPMRPVLFTVFKALTGSAAGALCFFWYQPLREHLTRVSGLPEWVPGDLLPMTISAAGFGGIYLAVSVVLGMREPREMLQSFRRRRAPSGNA